MNKKEFEKKIKELKLEKIYYQGRIQEYSKGIYEDNSKNSMYGCYFDGQRYVIFFKDSERGFIKEIGYYKTEEDAYDKLFETISEWAQKDGN